MLHLRKCHIYKGIVFANKPYQHSLYVSFSIQQQTRQLPPKKQIELTDTPPTPWPPINPKLFDYEKQKGPQKQQQPINRTINVGGLFLFAGVICGAIISMFQPTDFRNDFSFHSPLPDIYHTKIENFKQKTIPLSVKQTTKRHKNQQEDYANAMLYSICLGSGAGIVGHKWYKIWTQQLRYNQSNIFELTETIETLRAGWIRNCLKGTFVGSSCVLGIIYTSVFFSYLYLGQFFNNKYADAKFWDYMELQYKRSVEGLQKYELNLEFQERIREKDKVLNPPIAPAFKEKKINDMPVNENYEVINEQLKKWEKKKEIRRKSYINTYKGMEWNTELFLDTKDISYYKLDENAKMVRWNVSREMATLACASTLYIVLPVFLGANLIATRVYNNYWRRIVQDMIKTKEIPLRTY